MPSLGDTGQLLQLLGDSTRARLLALLSEEEFTVAELTSILEIGQSRISTHLGRLREANLVAARRSGASSYYRLAQMEPSARSLWDLVLAQVQDPLLEQDRERKLEHLRSRTGDWPETLAGQMERHYSPGRTWQSLSHSLLQLAQAGRVLDAGCGDGAVASLLAPRSISVTCLDQSETMLAAARRRCRGLENVRYCQGDFLALPFEGECFDQVLLLNVLCFSARPLSVLREAFRVLAPGGSVVISTLKRHAHQDLSASYGHQTYGFRVDGLRRRLREAGFRVDFCDVTSKERRKPHLYVITALAIREDESS